jgi:tRNA synthetases class II (A)
VAQRAAMPQAQPTEATCGAPHMSGDAIRQAFLQFYAGKGHDILPSSSLVPDDPTVLLTIAGPSSPYPWLLSGSPLCQPMHRPACGPPATSCPAIVLEQTRKILAPVAVSMRPPSVPATAAGVLLLRPSDPL